MITTVRVLLFLNIIVFLCPGANCQESLAPLTSAPYAIPSPATSPVATPVAPIPSQFIPFSVPNERMPSLPLHSTITNGQILTLTGSLDTALSGSPRMASVRALLGVAKSAYAQASALPNPGIYMSNVFHNNYLIGASIPVEPPWKLIFRLLIAKNQVEQAKLDILKSMWLFRGEVRRNYAQIVIAEEILKARNEVKKLAERIWQSSKTQYESGNAPGLDVRRAKLTFIQAKMDCEQAQIKKDQAHEQMNLVMGKSLDAPIIVPGLMDKQGLPQTSELLPNFDRAFPSRDQLIQMAKENRLDLKIAKQAIATNHANLRNAYGNILPTPRFVVGHARELNPPNPPGPTQNVPFMQAYIDAPIFNFQQGDIARFRATDKQLKLDLQGQENLVEGQVEFAYKNLFAARQRIKSFQDEALRKQMQ